VNHLVCLNLCTYFFALFWVLEFMQEFLTPSVYKIFALFFSFSFVLLWLLDHHQTCFWMFIFSMFFLEVSYLIFLLLLQFFLQFFSPSFHDNVLASWNYTALHAFQIWFDYCLIVWDYFCNNKWTLTSLRSFLFLA
jgi:hypothetical protein